jgi:hypothetical protein
MQSEDGASCVTLPVTLPVHLGPRAVDLDQYPSTEPTPTMSRPSTPTHLPTNGVGGHSTPETPVNHNFALTEYAVNPSPSPARSRADAPRSYGVPDDFLLPNGSPDVRVLVNGLIAG